MSELRRTAAPAAFAGEWPYETAVAILHRRRDPRWNPVCGSALRNSTNGTLKEPTMSSGTAKDFEDYARDCVRLAEQVDSPELREKLLQQAREWMHALIDEEDASGATGK